MEKLTLWLRRRGFKLEREAGADDCVCFDTARVLINSTASHETQLSALLHECGHVDVFQKRLKNRRARVAGATFGHWARTSNTKSRQALRVRISVVTEEIEAWDRGEVIAKRLKIRYNRKSFQNVRTRALMTYFRWTARRKQGR
jgi:hypothetical protein